jgi:hypothetical protein
MPRRLPTTRRALPDNRLAQMHWQAGNRPAPAPQVSMQGEAAQFVDPSEIPAAADVARLGRALAARRRGDLHELMANTEALHAYTEARDRLVDELGIDPGPALRELEARILAQDPSLAAGAPACLEAVPAPVATGNLREPLSSFVGRTGELEELTEAVRASRLVTLVGPGGVGKTPGLRLSDASALRQSSRKAHEWDQERDA